VYSAVVFEVGFEIEYVPTQYLYIAHYSFLHYITVPV
jgi:hypothetical protein